MKGYNSNTLVILFIFLIAGILISGISGYRVLGPAYVSSGSMESAIPAGSIVFVLPSRNLRVGDVVVFRPLKIESNRVAHRVVGITEEGLITRGDASLGIDQEIAGELPVAVERIMGKVFSINGYFPHIKGAHYIFAIIDNINMDKRLVLLILLIISSILASLKPYRQRVVEKRLRVKHLYLTCLIFCIMVFFASFMLSSGIKTVNYNLPVPQPGQFSIPEPAASLDLKVYNRSLIPVFHFIDAFSPLVVRHAPRMIAPLSSLNASLTIQETGIYGWQRSYIRVYHYPAILPYDIVVMLHAYSPYLVISVMAMLLSGGFLLLLQMIDGWLPLKVIWRKPLLKRRRLRRIFAFFIMRFIRNKRGEA